MNTKIIALCAGGLLTLVGLASGQGEMQDRQATRNQLTSLQRSAAINAAQAKVAEIRQDSGRCVFVQAPGQNEYTAISEGMRVGDAAQGVPLGNGAIVCDPWGGTGEVSNGVIVNYANGMPIQPNTPQPVQVQQPQEVPSNVQVQAEIK